MEETLIQQELFRNLAIVLSMALFVIFAISRIIYPKLFVSIYSFSKFFSFRHKDDFGSGIRLFSTESFYFTAVLSLNFSFIIICIFLFNSEFQNLISWLEIKSLTWGILVWVILALAIQFTFFLKFLLIRMFGWLFNVSSDQSRHFQEFQSMNNSFSLILYLLISFSIYIRFVFPVFSLKILAVMVGIYLVFRLINLFFKIRHLGAYSNLYIFSYLCSTELIPTLLGLSLFV